MGEGNAMLKLRNVVFIVFVLCCTNYSFAEITTLTRDMTNGASTKDNQTKSDMNLGQF